MTSYCHKPVQHKILNNSKGKCGEITFCMQVDKRVYALNCSFCSQICLQWETFINHMEQVHDAKLSLDYSLQSENEPELKIDYFRENFVEETEAVKKISRSTTTELLPEPQDLDDPLEEHYSLKASLVPINIESYELSANQTLTFDDREFVKRQMETNTQMDDELTDRDNDENNGDDISDDDVLSRSSYCSNENEINDNNKIIYDKRKLTELIIKYYKEHPILWKCSKTDSKNNLQHHEAYRSITKVINKEMCLSFKCMQIKWKINKLRSKFRKEEQTVAEFIEDKLKDDDDENDDVSFLTTMETQKTSWLYDKMSFLKDHMNYERKRKKRGTKALTSNKCYLPLAKLSNDENHQLIELYRGYPCLWDVNHIGFRFKTQRQQGLHELLEAVNTQMSLNLTLGDLQKKLYYIRYAFTQEKHRQIECEKLKIEFKPRCKLHSELLFLKESVGPFKCESCEQVFNGPDQYKIHKSSHDGSIPYTCPICKKGFMKVGNCTVHLRRHTKDYQFECKECGKKFPTSTDLNVHSRHHTGEKPYFCDICGQSFRTWTYFDSHRRRHEKNPNHKCSICFKGFYENNKLKQHMKSHMNVRDKVCNVCGKSFTCTKYLNQHKQTHSETKKYSCKMCGKNFAQYGGLSSHTQGCQL